MKINGKLERVILAILLLAVVYLVCLNRNLQLQLRKSKSGGQIVQPQTATRVSNATHAEAIASMRNSEYAEILRLRREVTQLSRELQDHPISTAASNAAAISSTDRELDTPLFTSSITNTVALGNFLIVGGWSAGDLRTYLLLHPTPVVENGSAQDHFSITSYVVRAPESVWASLGWGDAASDTHRSKLAGTLTAAETEALLANLKQNGQSTISASAPSAVDSGGHIGLGFSVEDEGAVGVLMAVDVYPRAIPGRESVELGITPSPVSDKVPIHKSLKRLAVNQKQSGRTW